MTKMLVAGILFAALASAALAQPKPRVYSDHDLETISLLDGLKQDVRYNLEEPIICPPGVLLCVVDINISNPDPDLVAVNPCLLRWTPKDWHHTKTVQITTVQDYVHTSDETRQIHLRVQPISSESALYRGYSVQDLYVESVKTASANCRATGRGHYTTFDGKYWHYFDGSRRNQTRIALYKSTKRDMVVQVQVRGNPAVVCAMAGREGNDRVMINNCGSGIRVEADFHTKKAEDQPQIDVSGTTYTIYFKSGAWMRAQVTSWGLNVWAESVDPGSTCGMCGNFDGNAGNDAPTYKVQDYNSLFECQKVSSAQYPTDDPCKNGINTGDSPSCDIWEYKYEEPDSDDDDDDDDEDDLPCSYNPTFVKPLVGAQDVEDITEFVKERTGGGAEAGHFCV